jgi:hypothetical protein
LRSRNFALLWVRQLISVVGDWLLFVGLPFAVYIQTGAALAAGALFVAETVPRLLLGPVAGVVVDRWDLHRLRPLAEG